MYIYIYIYIYTHTHIVDLKIGDNPTLTRAERECITPSLRSAKPSNHFRKPGGGFWKYVEQGRFLHVKSMIFM